MPIDIVCGKCKKRYKVDGKLAGKKVRCKACDNDIYVPVFESLDVPATVPDFPPAPTVPVQPLPPGPDSGAGQLAPPVPRPAFDVQRNFVRRSVRRDSRGYRITRPYENPILNWFEGATVITSQIIYWLSVLALGAFCLWIVILFARAASNGIYVKFQVWAIFIAMTPVYFVMTYYGTLPLMAAGVRIASSLMKFEVPEDPDWRALGAYQISVLVGLVMFLLIGAASVFTAGASRNGMLGGAVFLVGIVLFVVIIIPVHFFLTKIIFRLYVVETVVAYIFQLMVMLALNAVALALMLLLQFFNS